MARLARAEAGTVFDLARPPLLQVRLVRLAETEHAVLITLHHIVGDGWSMGVLARELAALYEARRGGRPSMLGALPLQYADFAVWQCGWLTGEVLEAELAHWQHQLAGAAQVLELPTDRPRSLARSTRGRLHPVSMPALVAQELRALALRQRATPFMVVLAAFAALLNRYTGQEDLLVGTPVAGRNWREVEDLIGLFANTLALRARPGNAPSFRVLLADVRAMTLEAYAHQDFPFEKLVERLAPVRDLARTPLFQAMLVLQNAPLGRHWLPDIALEPIETGSGTAKFDLTLSLTETARALPARSRSPPTSSMRPRRRRLAGHFEALLAAVVAAPEARLSSLPLLSAGERQQLLREWSGAVGEQAVGTAPEMFARQARRTPLAAAVVCGQERLSYGELAVWSAALARRLRELGVGPEVRVGIALERSAAMWWRRCSGCWRSGGAYVPLDPWQPRERLALIVEAAGLAVMVTQASLVGELPEHGARVVLMESVERPANAVDASGAPRRPPGRGGEPSSGESLVYVIFTSGSTGRPKGVQVTHRALASFLMSMRRSPGLAAGDALLAVTTLSFDIAGLELLLPLVVGARVEVASREELAVGVAL